MVEKRQSPEEIQQEHHQKKQIQSRRSVLTIVTGAALGFTAGVMGLFNMIFLKPRVTYGPSRKVRIGRPESYSPGSQLELPEDQLLIRQDNDGRFAAISTICTHLGCTVRATETGFACPCHGSNYDVRGDVVGGPAPTALTWYRVSLTPGGELEVDKDQPVDPQTYLELTS